MFGRDYDTPDGTCSRDYIHVADLADAHWLALDKLMQGAGSTAYNLGNGHGFSVQQVIDTAASITGRTIPVVDAPRRDGDPARLVDEYLSNVLPDDVFPRIRSCFGASTAPLPPSRRPVEQVADDLRASSVGLRIEQPPWREGGEC